LSSVEYVSILAGNLRWLHENVVQLWLLVVIFFEWSLVVLT